jgi:proteasome regulatory subunit
MPLGKGVNNKILASMSGGFSGAEIKAAVVEAGISAISSDRKSVQKIDFIRAIKKVEKNRKSPGDTNSEGIYA